MKKIIIIVVMLIGIINCNVVEAQFQIGQGINPWAASQFPQIHNASFVFLDPVPAVISTAGTRMDAFKDHPMQFTGMVSGLITDNLGLSLKVNHVKAGLFTSFDAQLALSYFVFLNKTKGDKWGFFAGGHFSETKVSVMNIIVIHPNDPGLDGMTLFQPNGNASVGIGFMRENKYTAGLSAFNLIQTKSPFRSQILTNPTQRAYYFVGSYVFELGEKIGLQPSGVAVFVNSKAYQWEVNLDLKYKKVFWIGGGYRSIGGIKFDLGLKAQSWTIGYCGMYGPQKLFGASAYTYKAFYNSICVKKVFNENNPNRSRRTK